MSTSTPPIVLPRSSSQWRILIKRHPIHAYSPCPLVYAQLRECSTMALLH